MLDIKNASGYIAGSKNCPVRRMTRLFTFNLIFLAGVFCFCSHHSIEENVQIRSHHIKLVIWPEQGAFSAMDSIGLDYKKVTGEMYFYLSESLLVEQVSVGDYHLRYSKLEKKRHLNKRAGISNTVVYRVLIPPNLSPPSVSIYYTGRFMPDSILPPEATGIPWINNKKIAFHSESFWYPSLPGSEFQYSLAVLAPDYYELTCNGQKATSQVGFGRQFVKWSEPNSTRIDFFAISSSTEGAG